VNGFIGRHFAHEYDLHFGPWLKWLDSLGMPFPLGGTSNHFRRDVLKSVGGWDPYNVTEDADLGFRLFAKGYHMGLLQTPTHESPPLGLREWLPQRARWIKGHFQTIITMTRNDMKLPPKGLLALWISLGFGVSSALFYGPVTLFVIAQSLLIMTMGLNWGWRETVFLGLPLLAWLGAALSQMLLKGPANRTMCLSEALTLPLYWMLQSIAALHALKQYFVSPFHWDKTPHQPSKADS